MKMNNYSMYNNLLKVIKDLFRSNNLLFSMFIHCMDLTSTSIKNSDIYMAKFQNVDFTDSNLLGIYPYSTIFENNIFSESTKIDSCLSTDLTDRILNKILRELRAIEEITNCSLTSSTASSSTSSFYCLKTTKGQTRFLLRAALKHHWILNICESVRTFQDINLFYRPDALILQDCSSE